MAGKQQKRSRRGKVQLRPDEPKEMENERGRSRKKKENEKNHSSEIERATSKAMQSCIRLSPRRKKSPTA